MKNPKSQAINSLFIIVGGALLLFEISGEERNVYVMVLGLIMLMLGLYRATNFWVDTKDDHKNEDGDTRGDESDDKLL